MTWKFIFFMLAFVWCMGIPTTLSGEYVAPPANDVCSGAIDLGMIECEFYADYDADPAATPDPEATGNCITNTEAGQWYTFKTPDPLEYGVLVHFSNVAKVEIFRTNSDCSELSYVDCGIGPFGFKPEPGTTYYYLTTGGLHIQPPSSGGSTCDDVLISYDYTQSPVTTSSYTDCAPSSANVVCQNDHVLWFGYTVGCGESSDVTISVSDYSADPSITANELSITVALWDCSVLLSEYDVNGLGYVCSGLVGGEMINLEDVPPGLSFVIGIGSDDYNAGYFDLHITESTNIGSVENDECLDAIVLDPGLNSTLSNSCAMPDVAIPGCAIQSEATVWYEFDPGAGLFDIDINLMPSNIENPAIAVYDACGGNFIDAVCDETLELQCIDHPILIQIGSALNDAGLFDMEILLSASLPPILPLLSGNDICSEEMAGIGIDFPGGEFVDVIVEVAPWSSADISGMLDQTFNAVNTATINDVLFNASSVPQEAIYLISVSAPNGYCPSEQIEYSISVNPGFSVNDLSLDECLPFVLDVQISELITGGTLPYLTTEWYWNYTELLGSHPMLNKNLESSGILTLEVVDGAGCMKSVDVAVELTPTITPTFDFPLMYCRSHQDIIEFPMMSLENITGSWSTPVLDLSIYTNDGTYETIFMADDPHCIEPVLLAIEIDSGDDPQFDLPDIICSDENEFVFPLQDLNGLEGMWEFPTIDVSQISGTQVNTFTPMSEDCYASFEYVFEVPEDLELEFGQPTMMCRNEAPYILNTQSMSGFEGTWDLAVIDPSTIIGNSVTATWTPVDGQYPCLGETSITIAITEPITPIFSLPVNFCSLDEVYVLPTNDMQALSGTWSLPEIDPSEQNGMVSSVFTPDDVCGESFIWQAEIVEPAVPEFAFELELCALDDSLSLPLTSDNGISGSWSIPTIHPSEWSGQQLEVEFIGDASEFCTETLSVAFEIRAASDPSFDLATSLCWTDEDIILPMTSDNGIEGTWNPSNIEVEINAGGTVSSTFTPVEGSCSNEGFQTFEVMQEYDVAAIVTDPTDCSIEDGIIELDVLQGDDLEYSIDGGTTWQSSTTFADLNSGGYMVIVRSAVLSHCTQIVEAYLTAPDGPMINDVLSMDISSCTTENGSIVVDAEGEDLEFSIDGGITWQDSNEFNDLPEGAYTINIREVLSDCVVDVNAMISDFPETQITLIIAKDLSNCDVEDGQIEIEADGEALEYSIDNGMTWSSENLFNNLPSGEYMIMVQSTTGSDCFSSGTVILAEPTVPNIVDLEIDNPTQCIPNTGSITINAEGSNLEYSIDGGASWQFDNVFDGLTSAEYQIIVRDSEKTNCNEEDVATIILEDDELIASTVIITPPSACDFMDARLEVSNVTPDVEFSIDGGLTWQTSSVFDNLLPGLYILITRKIAFPYCRVVQEIEIPNTACPCNDLILELAYSNLSCSGQDSALVEIVNIEGMKDDDYIVRWQDGTEENSTVAFEDGWQVVRIEYDDDCIWKDSVWVELIRPINFEMQVEDLDCPDSHNGVLEVVNVSGGRGDYTYSLDGINYQNNPVFENLDADTYEVYVRDETNCETIESIEVVTNNEVEVHLPEIQEIFLGESVLLTPDVDMQLVDDFTWSPSEGIIDNEGINLVVSPSITTIYTLDIFYGDCKNSANVLVGVRPLEEVYVGNVLSPNGDQNNDKLYLQGKANSTIVLNDFSIFDRWGNKVFYKEQPEFNNEHDGWDGYYNDHVVGTGVYVYTVNYTQFGKSKVKVGTVTIVF